VPTFSRVGRPQIRGYVPFFLLLDALRCCFWAAISRLQLADGGTVAHMHPRFLSVCPMWGAGCVATEAEGGRSPRRVLLAGRSLTRGDEVRAPARFWFPTFGALRDRFYCLAAVLPTRPSVFTPPSSSSAPSSSPFLSLQFPNCTPNHLHDMSGDPCLIVGSTVHTKAKNIRSAFTCTRMLGTRADDAMATGTVTEVTRAKVDGRMATSITGRFECLGKTRDKTLRIRSIRPGPAPCSVPPLPPPSSRLVPSASSQPPPHSTLPDAPGVRLAPARSSADATAPGSVSGASHAMAVPVGTQAWANRGPALLLQGAALLDAPKALPAGSPVTPPSPNHLALGLGSAADPPPPPPPSSRAATAPPSVEAHGFLWRERVVTQRIG